MRQQTCTKITQNKPVLSLLYRFFLLWATSCVGSNFIYAQVELVKYEITANVEELQNMQALQSEFIGRFDMTVTHTDSLHEEDNYSEIRSINIDDYGLDVSRRRLTDGLNMQHYIYNRRQSSFTLLNHYNKKAYKVLLPRPNIQPNDATVKIYRTENIKQIEGYKTIQYTIETNKAFYELWIAEIIPINYLYLYITFRACGSTENPAYYEFANLHYIPGMPLEGNYKTKDGQKTVSFTVKNFKIGQVDMEAFDTSDYDFIPYDEYK